MSQPASWNIAASSGLRTGCTAKICGWRQNGSIAREITVRPPIERYCFGPPDPARSPRPAATMIAAVRLGVGIVVLGGIREVKPGVGRVADSPYHAGTGKQKDSRTAVRILLHCTCKMGKTV